MNAEQQFHLWQFYKELRSIKNGGPATLDELINLVEILLEDESEPDWEESNNQP